MNYPITFLELLKKGHFILSQINPYYFIIKISVISRTVFFLHSLPLLRRKQSAFFFLKSLTEKRTRLIQNNSSAIMHTEKEKFQSTVSSYAVSGYPITTLLDFLLGDVSRKVKTEILEEAAKSRELSAFIAYLQRLLEAHDYDAERVAMIAQQQTSSLLNVLEELTDEWAVEETSIRSQYTDCQEVTTHTADTRDYAPTHEMHLTGMTFDFTISANHNRLPPTDPLSIIGVMDSKSPLHQLKEDIVYELARHPLDEQGLKNLLIVWRDQLQGRSVRTVSDSNTFFQKFQSWLPSLSSETFNYFTKRFIRGTGISGSPPPSETFNGRLMEQRRGVPNDALGKRDSFF